MTLALFENISLKAYNTLAVEARARYFLTLEDRQQIPAIIAFASQRQLPVMVLGQGSNVVFADDFPGVVIKMALRGIEVRDDGDGGVRVDVAAGENWHQLVCDCLQQGFYGLENLALIPGTAGAAPIQNIGAYGVELDSVLESVSGWDIPQASWRTLSAAECQLAYRDSIFKGALKDTFIITSICLRLSRRADPACHYGALAEALNAQGIRQPTPQQVAEAVIGIRRSKLPDPADIPNVGSFFKNPIVSEQQFQTLRRQFPALVSYPQTGGGYKLAAGWLLEEAGWKGAESGELGMHSRQSLVLVNYGRASGAEVLAFAKTIQHDILEKFSLALEIEPRIYGSVNMATGVSHHDS